MLRTDEFLEIENKWKKYKKRQSFKIFLIIIFVTIILLLLLAILNILILKSSSVDANENNLSKNTNITNIALSNSSSILTNMVNATDSDMNSINITNKIDNPKEDDIKTSKIETKNTKKELVSSVKAPKKELNNNIKPPASQNAVQNVDTAPIQPKKPNNILIETKEINNTDALINRFNATRNIVLAIMISEEFYEKSDYSNSLKWALIANDIDSKNEKSWIMFAKSKAKQGKTDEAMHALQVFISHSPNSNNAKSLLESLKNENLNN